jgi:hypothetical protein
MIPLWARLFRLYFLSSLLFVFVSCTTRSPEGEFSGEIKDWVHEVFQGKYVSAQDESPIELILRQTPNGMLAEMTFQHPQLKVIKRTGTWEVGDGERVIRFDDDKSPSEYYLIKRGVRFAFQTKEGLSNDDGSPILLMRNVGVSRKSSYPLEIKMKQGGEAVVKGGAAKSFLAGEWRQAGQGFVVITKLLAEDNNKDSDSLETYKYFLEWGGDNSQDLILKKIVLTRPFLKKDGTKRQSWMSSLIFNDNPRLKRKG